MSLEVEHKYLKQECIPVGCVPPASVAIFGGGECLLPKEASAEAGESAWGRVCLGWGVVCLGGVCL